jgi:hypothetical protein
MNWKNNNKPKSKGNVRVGIENEKWKSKTFKKIWERAEEATVKSGGEPLSELIRSGAGGSHRENSGAGKKGGGGGVGCPLCVCVCLALSTTSGGDGTFSPFLFLCTFFFGRVVLAAVRSGRQASCSPIGRHPIRWEG